MKEIKIFPKLFIGAAAQSFKSFLKKNSCDYEINYVTSYEDLEELISVFSGYKNYSLPVIISDISFLNKKAQSLLLKFMDDSNLKLILLASRDNILDTIISRVKEFRKFYIFNNKNKASFIELSKAREMLSNDVGKFDEDTSYEDKLLITSKYNPMLSYDNELVKRFSFADRNKLLNLIEYSNE